MNFKLKVWRQKNASTPGKLVDYTIDNVNADQSFLEMVDVLNDNLVRKGEPAIAFDHDCREGICGMCSLQINGLAHGPKLKEEHAHIGDEKPRGRTTCQLYMREFKDGDTITIEPFRAKAFPVVRDLVVDRSAFDRIMNK